MVNTPDDIRSLFAALEVGDEAKFLQLYYAIPVSRRLDIWKSRKSPRYEKSSTLVHTAARLGHDWLIKFAIREEADVCLVGEHNKQPLHEAAQTGSLSCVRALLHSPGILVDPLKRADWTPLMLACAASFRGSDALSNLRVPPDHFNCVNLLLQYGASPSFTNKDGWNCLHIAARACRRDIVIALLNHSPELIHTSTFNGRTSLHCLASCAPSSVDPDTCCTIATILLDHLPSLHLIADACGSLPVFDALCHGNIRLACTLLQTNAEEQLTYHDKVGQQAVHVATQAGMVESLRLIEAHLGYTAFESRISYATVMGLTGATPLHLACRSGHVDAVKFILDTLTRNNRTFDQLVDVLCSTDYNGNTPFHYAVIGCAGCSSVQVFDRINCIVHLCRVLWPPTKKPHEQLFVLKRLNSLYDSVCQLPMKNFLAEFSSSLSSGNRNILDTL